MKCLVFSDSHGSVRNMREAMKIHKDAEVVFFLGDGLTDLEQIAISDRTRAYIAVRGNCDHSSLFLSSEVGKVEKINIGGYKIVLTHGDLFGAKYGLASLINLARSEEGDILLFGHTHTPCEKYVSDYERPFYLFNPGSASLDGGSYGVMILDKVPFFSHGSFL